MKKYLIPLIIILAAFLVVVCLYLGTYQFEGGKPMQWKEKENQVRSRLLEVPILLYHNIDGAGDFSISLDVLRQQFEILRAENIKVISLKELIKRLEDPVPFDGDVIVITFDDGYPSMYTKMMPLVKEFNYPVTLFVYTDFIHIRPGVLLDWKSLIEMDSELLSIQCHSISHADLEALSEKDSSAARKQLFDEIFLSKRMLEVALGKEIEFFAFPYGRYNIHLLDLCAQAGYRRVFSTDYGANIITTDNYSLRRHHIKKDFSLDLFKKIVRNKR